MASAASILSGKHWVYLDAQRTHEVHAQSSLADGRGYLVTTEFPMGSREPGEMVQAHTPVRGEDELIALLGELEERLALTGTYYRAESAQLTWSRLAPPTRALDLRAHEAPIPGMEATGGRMRFHHFHSEAAKDRLLIAMPRPGMSGRHILAEMDFEFPRVDEGSLSVLHARLAAPLLTSAVAKEHVEAPRKGFLKLFEAADYERTFGDGWTERTRQMFSRAAARLIGGAQPAAGVRSTVPRHHPPAQLEQMRAALASGRIEALKYKYVDPQTEAVLVGGGEHTVRRFIAGLRKKLPHHHSYDISVLEAALLCQYAIPSHMWDLASDEGGKLLRYLHGYA